MACRSRGSVASSRRARRSLIVDPGVEVLATYIEEPFAGATGYFLDPFQRPDLGRQRAEVLYERADVVFHAASASGFGVFDAVVELSERQGRQLWAIGVDNDQWLQATARQRYHLLASMIKRMDLAAYQMVHQVVDGTLAPGVRELDLSDGAMELSTRGNGLSAAMVDRLAQLEADIVAGHIIVPTTASGDPLSLDPLPPGFSEAFAGLSEQQILDYYDEFLVPGYPRDVGLACIDGTMRQCGQLMLDHVDEWRAEQRS